MLRWCSKMFVRDLKIIPWSRCLRPLVWRWTLKTQQTLVAFPTFVWCVLGVLGVLVLYKTLFLHTPGIHVQCECGQRVATGERVARYLQTLMAELDSFSNRTTLEEIEASHPSLAIRFLNEVERGRERCATTPSLFSIHHSNGVWQRGAGASLLLYGAYWDDRGEEGPSVRVLVMANSPQLPTPHCLFYSAPHLPPTSTRAVRIDYVHWQEKLEGHWLPYLVTCRAGVGVAAGVGVPRAVSLVGSECETPTNALRVHHNPPPPPVANPRPPRPLGGNPGVGVSDRGNQGQEEPENGYVNLFNLQNLSRGTPGRRNPFVRGPNSLKPLQENNPDPLEPPPGPIRTQLYPEEPLQNQEDPRRTQVNPLRGPKKDLALCHKFIFNPARDFSLRLVEWIEVARAWGVDSITFYLASAHPNVTRVLRHYQNQGYVAVIPWASPDLLPTIPHLYRALFDTQRYVLFTNENIPYTDCLLRHISSHRYVAVWDMDEFILPGDDFHSLPAMMDAVKTRAVSQGLSPASYLARCAYYFDDLAEAPSSTLPDYLNILRHVTRSVKFTPPAVFSKSIHDTEFALGLHAHFALVTLHGEIDRRRDLYHLYPSNEGHLAHYRLQCQGEDQTECQQEFRPFLTRDLTMWRYRGQVVARVREILLHLALIHPHPP